jgi:hypothetical protein
VYTKPAQAQFTTNIADGEFVVELESGEFVAVQAIGSVEPNTGNAVITARARQVMADGGIFIDAAGQTVESAYVRSADVDNVKEMGGMGTFQKLMLLTVLGEPAPWPQPLDKTVLDHCSIRTNIAAAAHAGVVPSLGELL